MMDRFEILYSKLRRLVSRNRWSARLLGYPPVPHSRDDGVGLVLIQIDGLGRKVLDRALEEGRMPFLRHLIQDDGYRLRDLYSGLPSSTPGAQAELFYRARTFVPAFGFWDREVGKVVRMNDPSTAARVESELVQEHDGLMKRGSAWSNIYAGEAAEPHLCASTTGLDMLLKALDPTRIIGLVLWHGWSVVRVTANLVAETLLAIWDFFRGTIAGRNLMAELRFIPPRVVVTALMREIITAGAAIDCERGLPVVQLNYLGYDEHGHRRGPDSRFALWTLKGIDRSIRRVWLAAHRSPRRDYQVWIYSDHGQERTLSYPLLHGEDVRTAIARVYEEWRARAGLAPQFDPDERRSTERSGRRKTDPPPALAIGTEERLRWLEQDLPEWLARSLPGEYVEQERRRRPSRRQGDVPPKPKASRPAQLEVVNQGPIGFAYLDSERTPEELVSLARAVARRAHVPAVLCPAGPGRARGFLADGTEVRLPEDTARVVGEDHPFLPEVTDDLLRVVHHANAGDLTLLGYSPEGAQSLQLENGAHGGPGPRETHAFALLPREACDTPPPRLRMSTLYDLARAVTKGRNGLGILTQRSGGRPPTRDDVLAGRVSPRDAQAPATAFRIVTYNVHSCRGMDGVYSPSRIARALLREQPDIICLQELEHGIGRSGWALQVSEIAESLSTDYHFHGISRVDDGDFGNAILSAHRMERVKSGSLPVWAGKRRGVLWVTVEIDGTKFHVLNTHLSIVERERKMQADALLGPEWLGGEGVGGPVILCGDFNASRRSYTCRRVAEVLHNVDPAHLPIEVLNTWSSRMPLRRIDHVFVSRDLEVKQTYVPRTRLTRVASDHLPLVVDLEFGSANGGTEA